MAPAPDGWGMKTLFRDWGDTGRLTGDGGYETAAIVVKNLGEGTPHPFDRKLSDKYANDAAKAMFALSILADSTEPGVTLGTSVNIDSADTGGRRCDYTRSGQPWSSTARFPGRGPGSGSQRQ